MNLNMAACEFVGQLDMQFQASSNPMYSIESIDGKFKLARTVKDAGPRDAYYTVSWGEPRRAWGTTLAKEELPENPSKVKIIVILDYASLERYMSSHSTKLLPAEEAEFRDTLAQAICELHRLREGKFAELLRMQFEVVLLMPDGQRLLYRNGIRVPENSK